MEKFSTWRDKGTGISPFIAAENPAKPVQKYVVHPVLLALKWPLFLALYAFFAVAPKPALKLIFRLLGVEIDLSVDGVRKTKTAEIDRNRPAAGDIVVANCVSPLDILVVYLTSRASFSSIVVVVPHNDDLYALSAWEGVSMCFGLDLGQCTKATSEMISSWRKKLVVVFPEGTSSNNKAVLPLDPAAERLFTAADSPLKTAVLRYYPGGVSLPLPIGKSQYVSRLLTMGKIHVKVKLVPQQRRSLGECKTAFSENGLSSVQLGVADKAAFLKYSQEYALKNITK